MIRVLVLVSLRGIVLVGRLVKFRWKMVVWNRRRVSSSRFGCNVNRLGLMLSYPSLSSLGPLLLPPIPPKKFSHDQACGSNQYCRLRNCADKIGYETKNPIKNYA